MEIVDRKATAEMAYYDPKRDCILTTLNRMGSSSLTEYGRRAQLKGLHRLDVVRYQNKGIELWSPMRNPIERAHSAYRHPGVRSRYQGKDFHEWWENAAANADLHVFPVTGAYRRWNFDLEKIRWVIWEEWVQMFDMPGKKGKIHANRSDRANLKPVEPNQAMLDYYAEDLAIFNAITENHTPHGDNHAFTVA